MAGTLSATALLTAWERGRRLSPAGRGEEMLRAAGNVDAALDRLPVGRRNALLMDFRARVFGTHVAGVVSCPACHERLDVTFDLHDIWIAPASESNGPVRIEAEGYSVDARPPSSADLLSLEACESGADLRSILLRRCVLNARHDGAPVDVGSLPETVISRISAALAEADPQADVRLGLSCPACGHAWMESFDIASYLWQELETWAWRMARDVDALAARYGWSEAEILAMSPERRALYLEVARA